jgi:hypothetical protein
MRNLQSGRAAAIVTISLVFGAISAWAQKVETGFDKAADFSKYKTYAWIPRVNPAANPALATILDQNIEYELNEKGLHKVDSNPDLLVKSYSGPADVQSSYAVEDPNFTATGGYPLPGGNMWGGSLAAAPNPHVMTGSITVDLIDAREKHVVWRGTAKGKVDYEKRSKMLDKASKAVMEMFKKYPPTEANQH